MGVPKTLEDLLTRFDDEARRCRVAAHEASVQADVWDDAACWVRTLADAEKKAKS